MENKTSSGYEKLGRSASEITGNTSQLSNSKTSLSFHQGLSSEDILLEDYSEEEIFVLREEYVQMEGEYVMCGEMSAWKAKSRQSGPGNDDEGQLVLPVEDSLQSLGEYFTLKNSEQARHFYMI